MVSKGKHIILRRTTLAVAIYSVTSMVSAVYGDTEELLVIGSKDRHQIDVADTVEIIPDAAALLRKAPGANVNGNGPLSGIPQYRGMYGGRINVEVNGMALSPGGPNWMDPPLHYAPAAQLQSLEVYRGIAPVSAGQETIGGAVKARTWDGEFSNSKDFVSSSRIRSGGQSVNNASVVSVAIVQANQNHRFKLSGITESADDAEFDGGEIIPTEYERDRYDVGYGYQRDGHSWRFDIGRNETGDAGTPALPMDIMYIDNDIASTQYSFDSGDWSVSAKLYYSNVEHAMSNYHLRQAPAGNAMWRRSFAGSDSLGFKLSGELKDINGSWTAGIDGHSVVHNADIDNPNNAMFFVNNFNDVERDILGIFAERKQKLNEQWVAEFGLRFNQVEMDADPIDGTPARMTMMGMSPGQMLRDNFNNSDRSQTDNNVDWLAKFYYQVSDTTSYYFAVASKTRSASYQERYLWLPLQSVGGLADGRTYTGNVNLDPETSAELELGFDFDSERLSVSPRLFYREIDDYIQGTVSTNMNAVMFVNMMNIMSGANNAAPLEFNNVDATLYGFDMDWAYQLNSQFSLNGLLNYVRGERDDIDDNLYRIAPVNATVALTYQSTQWSLTAESVLYAKQDKVSVTNGEQESAGYGLVNLRGYWQINNELRLGFGVENALDKRYEDHLAGYNRAANPDVAIGDHLPGFGRNFFARVDYGW